MLPKYLIRFLFLIALPVIVFSQDENIKIGNIKLTQYTRNTLYNPYNIPLEVVGIVTIPGHSAETFETGGQDTVEIKAGKVSRKFKLKPNLLPKIEVQQLVNMDENSSYTELSAGVGFRLSIVDDFPGQLDVKFNGPVTLNNSGKNTFDLTLNAFEDKNAFEKYAKKHDSPYILFITITITDRIASHKITGECNFIFGKYKD